MKIFLLTDISKTIGLGHYKRILPIFNELKSISSVESYLLIQGSIESVTNFNGALYDWSIFLLNDYEISNSDVIVIDSYLVDKKFFKNLLKFTKKVFYFDDFRYLDLPDIKIINPSIMNNSNGYVHEDLVYSGPKFVPIKPEIKAINKKRTVNKNSINVLVYLGGAQSQFDLNELFSQILIPGLNIEIVFISITDYENITFSNSNLKIEGILNEREFAEVLSSIDIAIVSLGQIIFDLIYLSIPFIGIKTSESQSKNIDSMRKFFPSALILESSDSIFDFKKTFELAIRSDYQDMFISLTSQLFDGLGLERIVNLIRGR